MKHQFTQDILLINDAFTFGKDLIKLAEEKNKFGPALVANSADDNYEDVSRTNSAFNLNIDTVFVTFIEKLNAIVEKSFEIYVKYNPLVCGSTVFGYDLLKYEKGQKFDTHVDAIYGNTHFQNRQLSCLLYLNDDYKGGETKFLRQNLQIKPPAGSVAVFPPFYTHPHSGEPVICGVKYVAVTWLY